MVGLEEFESFIGVMIAINAVLMGFEVDLAQSGDVAWIVLENFFCLLWITEMLLKLRAKGTEYFCIPFNAPGPRKSHEKQTKSIQKASKNLGHTIHLKAQGLRLQPCASRRRGSLDTALGSAQRRCQWPWSHSHCPSEISKSLGCCHRFVSSGCCAC